MKALIDTDINAFADRVLPLLRREPVASNVLATELESALAGRRSVADVLWLVVVDSDGAAVGAAMHTPPYRLFVAPSPPGAMSALARTLVAHRPNLPGVTGLGAGPEEFARQWRELTGATVTPGMAQRVYSLNSVIAPTQVVGRLRLADHADRDLLMDWTAAFHREAVPDQPMGDLASVADRVIADGGGGLWEVDGKTVCYANARLPAAGVARIGPVYTPPAERRRGYAGGCVAAISQRSLDRGAEYCMLYTDLTNPTSNGVYQRLGYRPVGDAHECTFSH